MKLIRSTPQQKRRFTRLLAWAIALLQWIVTGAGGPATARHRRRYGHISIAQLTRFARDLILLRALHLLARRRTPKPPRNFARAGFRRRMRVDNLRRALGGSWLRKRLRAEGGALAQLGHLLALLRNIDVIAGALAARRRTGLTRLFALVVAAPPAAALFSAPADAPCAADSS